MASKLTIEGGVALVTGAAAGIGKETALVFAEAGAQHVVFADLNQQGAAEATKEGGELAKHSSYSGSALEVDVTDATSVQAMVEKTIEMFGRIDYFVHSAGIPNVSGALTPEINTDAFAKIIETNLTGTMLCLRAVSGAMAKQEPRSHTGRHGTRSLGRGSIVCLGSLASYVPMIGAMGYSAAKHAVIAMVKTAAIDNAKSHIRVNAVCPGWVDTPLTDATVRWWPFLEKSVHQGNLLGRIATPEEVADYIVFLCSPFATYINGTGLVVDAGASCGVAGY